MPSEHEQQFAGATIAHETGVVENGTLVLSDEVHAAMKPMTFSVCRVAGKSIAVFLGRPDIAEGRLRVRALKLEWLDVVRTYEGGLTTTLGSRAESSRWPMSETTEPKLVFSVPFDERAAFEAEARGHCGYASVQLPSGALVPVVFWDVVRLGQDLETEAEAGRPFVAEPAMIVLTSVTLENMERAVQRLFVEGFFDSFRQ